VGASRPFTPTERIWFADGADNWEDVVWPFGGSIVNVVQSSQDNYPGARIEVRIFDFSDDIGGRLARHGCGLTRINGMVQPTSQD
jgi:hypothetical protein